METIRWFSLITILGLLGITLLVLSIKIVRQYERGVVRRFGRPIPTRDPGLNMIIPMPLEIASTLQAITRKAGIACVTNE